MKVYVKAELLENGSYIIDPGATALTEEQYKAIDNESRGKVYGRLSTAIDELSDLKASVAMGKFSYKVTYDAVVIYFDYSAVLDRSCHISRFKTKKYSRNEALSIATNELLKILDKEISSRETRLNEIDQLIPSYIGIVVSGTEDEEEDDIGFPDENTIRDVIADSIKSEIKNISTDTTVFAPIDNDSNIDKE